MDYRKLARGKPCMVRLPRCSHDRSTTVLAHYRLSPYCGTGIKPDDYIWGAWCCSTCHDLIDGRVKYEGDKGVLRLAHSEGIHRTQEAIKELGYGRE